MAETEVKTENKEGVEKEQLSSALSEGDILALVRDWESEAEEFYGLLKRIWEQNIEYYKGNQTDVGLIRGNGFEPKIKPESYAASVVADRYT